MPSPQTLHPFYDRLLSCKTEQDFNDLFNDLRSLEEADILKFLYQTGIYEYGHVFERGKKENRRCIKISNPEYFWASALATEKAEVLFRSPYCREFLFGLFGHVPNACAHQNTGKLASVICPSDFKQVIKITQCFLNKQWHNWLQFLENFGDSGQRIFLKEINFLFHLQTQWEKDQLTFSARLSAYPIDEVLIQVCACHEKFKRATPGLQNNRAALVCHEVSLCYVLDDILMDYRTINCTQNKQILPSLHPTDYFYEYLHSQLPPLNSPEGLSQGKYLPEETINVTKREIRDCIEFYFSLRVFKNIRDFYCTGMADFEEMVGMEAELMSNNGFAQFTRNDFKNKYIENYYWNNSVAENGVPQSHSVKTDRVIAVTSAACLQQFKALKIDNLNGKEKELDRILDVLLLFSRWFMPQGRTICLTPQKETEEGTWVQPTVFKQLIPDAFKTLFHSDYMVCYTRDELISKTTQYFKWTEKEAGDVMDFLTYDINLAYAFNPGVLYFPLIKAGDVCYWMSSLLRDRHWGNSLHTRVIKERWVKGVAQAGELEKSIASMFNAAGFNAVASFKYGGGEGETDILVYKDGILLFIELKTSFVSEDLLAQSKFDVRMLDYKAGGQLTRATAYFDSHFETFKDIKDLKIDLPKEAIQVKTLVVSNVFDWDDTLKDSKHLKISLTELDIILRNRLFYLLNTYLPDIETEKDKWIPFHLLDAVQNRNHPNLVQPTHLKYSREDCDLWKGEVLTFRRFFDIIEQDKVWAFLDRHWKADSAKGIKLRPYDWRERHLTPM